MKSIIEIMRENSKKIENQEQLKILREILEPAFEELIIHSEKMYESLENRVINEINKDSQNYQIKTTLLSKEELNYNSLYLSPILKLDLKDIDNNVLLYDVQNKGKVFYKKIYVPLDNSKINEILNNENTGFIIQNNKKYEVKFTFKKCLDYKNKEIEIYNLFLKNNVKWNTINFPYAEKILEVYIENNSQDINEVTEIDSIEFNFRNLPYIENLIPVWNIFEKKTPVIQAIIPAEDKINYIYTLSSEDFKSKEISILPFKENVTIKSISRTDEGQISIICDSENTLTWDFYIFKNTNEYNTESLKYPIYFNGSEKIFDKFNSIIRTEAEVYRKVELYKTNSNIQLKKLQIKDFYEVGEMEIITKNDFIQDEIRTRKNNKILKLDFEIINKNIYDYEIIRYIISQLQMDFLDFDCRGQII